MAEINLVKDLSVSTLQNVHSVVTYHVISVFLEKIMTPQEQHMSKNFCLNEK